MVKSKQEMKDNATFPGSVEIDEFDDQTKNKHELLLRHCIKTTNASTEKYIKELIYSSRLILNQVQARGKSGLVYLHQMQNLV